MIEGTYLPNSGHFVIVNIVESVRKEQIKIKIKNDREFLE